MKKFLLLISASASIGMSLNAQESNRSVIFANNGTNLVTHAENVVPLAVKSSEFNSASLRKTTSSTSRWYNYSVYNDTFISNGGGTTSLGTAIIWNDTIGRVVYSSGIAHNKFVSAGSILHPQFLGFNDPLYYDTTGLMQVKRTNAYTIDSVEIFGVYDFAISKPLVKDTLTLTFVHGNGGSTTDIGSNGYIGPASFLANYGLSATDTLDFAFLRYDSVKNTAKGTSAMTMKIVLDSSTWKDTFASGVWVRVLALPTPLSVPAGDIVGISMSFKSGDPTFPTSVGSASADDTIAFARTTRYSIFRPLVDFKTSGTATAFAPYHRGDFNSGQYKRLPNFSNDQNAYTPMFGYATSTGAYFLQNVDLAWHINCPTCTTAPPPVDHTAVGNVNNNIANINAVPNPANDEVAVTYYLTSAMDISITLSDYVGKVISTKNVANVKNGKATFNTSNLANGVYFYTVIASGERSTGRVVIAH